MALRKRMVWAATLMLCVALVAGFIVGHFVAPPAEAALYDYTLRMSWLHATYRDAVGVYEPDMGTSRLDVTYYLSSDGNTWLGPYDAGSGTTYQSSTCPGPYALKTDWTVQDTPYPYIKWHVVVQGGNNNGTWERNCNTLSSLQAEKWIQPLFPGIWPDAIAAWR